MQPTNATGTEPAYQGQAIILLGLSAAYVVGTLQVMQSWPLAASGLALSLLGIATGRLLRRFPLTIWEPLVLWFVGDMALFSIGLEVEFPIRTEWVALIALASFTMIGTWAIHRLPLRLGTVPSAWMSIGTGIAMGIILTIAVAPLVLVIAATGSDPNFRMEDFGFVAAAYCAAGLLGGIAVALLRPLATLALARMIMGVVVATIIYGMMGVAMNAMESGQQESLREIIAMGLAIG
ncbi:MAG: hypothetical protein ACODAB_08580, partial [Gemmatimonadota bacterium]